MNNYIQDFQDRLRQLFESKAAEFSQNAAAENTPTFVTTQLAGLYKDLAEAMSH
jgi:hypothetical protein